MIIVTDNHRIATDNQRYTPQYKPIGTDPEDKNSWIAIGSTADLESALDMICEYETRIRILTNSDPVSLAEAFQIRSQVYREFQDLTEGE